jgi:hypothetical protein
VVAVSERALTPAEAERKPFTVRCGECRHEWIAGYTPMEMGRFAKLLRGACCPMCGADSKKLFLPCSPGKSVDIHIAVQEGEK